jgi:hypothetical protein
VCIAIDAVIVAEHQVVSDQPVHALRDRPRGSGSHGIDLVLLKALSTQAGVDGKEVVVGWSPARDLSPTAAATAVTWTLAMASAASRRFGAWVQSLIA